MHGRISWGLQLGRGRCLKRLMPRLPRTIFRRAEATTQAAVVEHFEFVCNDKRNNAAIEALLEHDKAPHAAIAVLKRMDAFKAYMQVKDVLKSVMACMVVIKQSFHVLGNVLWRAGLFAADFI